MIVVVIVIWQIEASLHWFLFDILFFEICETYIIKLPFSMGRVVMCISIVALPSPPCLVSGSNLPPSLVTGHWPAIVPALLDWSTNPGWAVWYIFGDIYSVVNR